MTAGIFGLGLCAVDGSGGALGECFSSALEFGLWSCGPLELWEF